MADAEANANVPRLCLNMIVRNESKIITRMLSSVLPIIDTYCICDTGSTDDTKEVITKFMDEHKIKGKIVECEFKNFSYSRTYAIQQACEMEDVDYILLMDADMILDIPKDAYGKQIFDKKWLWKTQMVTMLQGDDEFYYPNMRIAKKHKDLCYKSVTHEYLEKPKQFNTQHHIEKNVLFIKDIGDGGCKSDKYERDIRLLTQGLIDEPNNSRYAFYLANSYYCISDFDNAIKHYRQAIEMDGWIQEVWYSYYRIGLCYQQQKQMDKAIEAWMDGYQKYPHRIEALFKAMEHFIDKSENYKAHMFYLTIKSIIDKFPKNRPVPEQDLFVEANIYNYKLYYQHLIMSYYVDRDNAVDLDNSIVKVLNNCRDESQINTSLRNLKFYKQFHLPAQKTINISQSYTIEDPLNPEKRHNLVSSTPCIHPALDSNNNNLYDLNLRFVNYHINDNGTYTNTGQIMTHNRYLQLNKSDFKQTRCLDFKFAQDNRYYVGVEDVRIFPVFKAGKTQVITKKGKKTVKTPVIESSYKFIGTGYHQDNKIGISVGDYNTNVPSSAACLTPIDIKCEFNQQSCEKNWVYAPFICPNSKQPIDNVVIYSWFPMTLGIIDVTNKSLVKLATKTMPQFFKYVRGSSCGFPFEGKIWFLAHIVSYEQPRQYYHVIIITDVHLNVLKYSAPFKLSTEPIEYSVSLIVETDRVIIPYSTWDRQSFIGIYDRKTIDNLVKYTM